jgi:hypothetical protein
MRLIFVAAVLLFCPLAWGQSQESPRQNAQGTQQNTETEQRGTERAPFVIKIQPEQTQQKTSTSSENGIEKRTHAWSLSDKIAAVASIAALLQFIALITTVGVMLWTATRQMRAYVYADNAGLYEGMMLTPPIPIHTNEPGVVLVWRNTGQTPAIRVISWGQIAVIEPINEHTLVVPPLQDIYFNNLGAGGTANKAIWYGRALTAAEITDIAIGTRAIYLYGRIEYRTISKRKKWTDFRFRYVGPFPPPQGVIFQVCERGNEAK